MAIHGRPADLRRNIQQLLAPAERGPAPLAYPAPLIDECLGVFLGGHFELGVSMLWGIDIRRPYGDDLHHDRDSAGAYM